MGFLIELNFNGGDGMNYWLLKSEPNTYSFKDLKSQSENRTYWDGVRNYSARNNMRRMRVGDQAFFYHSVVKPTAIVGIVRIVKETYPDFTQFDPQSNYYDPKSTKENPRWDMIDVEYLRDIDPPITLDELKNIPEIENMALLRRGRLSVQPVTENEWKVILSLRK
jgi:predicted RNA-binding protein with PUA-like domain